MKSAARPRDENVVDLMEALRRSVGAAEPAKASKSSKKPRNAHGPSPGGRFILNEPWLASRNPRP